VIGKAFTTVLALSVVTNIATGFLGEPNGVTVLAAASGALWCGQVLGAWLQRKGAW
jgi:hypothetical protein